MNPQFSGLDPAQPGTAGRETALPLEAPFPSAGGRFVAAGIGAFVCLFAVLLTGCASPGANRAEISSGQVSVTSPDGTIALTIRGNGPLTYAVSVDSRPVLADSRLGLKFKDGAMLGANTRLVKVERSRVNRTWEDKFGKRRVVRDHHNELRVFLEEQSGRPFEIVVRAFDDGIGFRYVLPAVASAPTQDFVIAEEQTRFAFPENDLCYVGVNENTGKPQNPVGYLGSQESEFKPVHLSDLPTDQVRMLPLLVKTPAAWVAITESDLYDWAGMWLSRVRTAGDAAGVTLAARLAPRPDGQGLVKSTFPHNSPWRTFIVARQPGPVDRERSGVEPVNALRAA